MKKMGTFMTANQRLRRAILDENHAGGQYDANSSELFSYETAVVFDNRSTGFDCGVPEAARLVVADVGDAKPRVRLIEEHRVDAIAHLAAKIAAPESIDDPFRPIVARADRARSVLGWAPTRVQSRRYCTRGS
jgi:NAD dependent epimerase/dehydratase family